MTEKKSVRTVRTRWGLRPVKMPGYYPEQGRVRGYYNRLGDFICDAPFFQFRQPKDAQQIIDQFVAA